MNKEKKKNITIKILTALSSLIYLITFPFFFFMGAMSTDAPGSGYGMFYFFCLIPVTGIFLSVLGFFRKISIWYSVIPAALMAIPLSSFIIAVSANFLTSIWSRLTDIFSN